MILRPSYLHNGISYTGKTTSLYWIVALLPKIHKPWDKWPIRNQLPPGRPIIMNLIQKATELLNIFINFCKEFLKNIHQRHVWPLRWRHNERDCVLNHQPYDCLLNRLFRRRSKKISKLRVTGLCAGNSPGTGEFPAQMASNAENVSIWWRHHDILNNTLLVYSKLTSHSIKTSKKGKYSDSRTVQFLAMYSGLPVKTSKIMRSHFSNLQEKLPDLFPEPMITAYKRNKILVTC